MIKKCKSDITDFNYPKAIRHKSLVSTCPMHAIKDYNKICSLEFRPEEQSNKYVYSKKYWG